MYNYGEIKHWPPWIDNMTRLNHVLLALNSSINIVIYTAKDFKFRRALVNLWLCRSDEGSQALRSRSQSINNNNDNSNSLGQGPSINISHGLNSNSSEGEKIEMTGPSLSRVTRLTLTPSPLHQITSVDD